MRELERDLPDTARAPRRTGRLPRARDRRPWPRRRPIARAAGDAGLEAGRAAATTRRGRPRGAGAALLCVPDAEIEEAAAAIARRSAAALRRPHQRRHRPRRARAAADARRRDVLARTPCRPFPTASTDLTGAPCAVAGSTPEALAFARSLAEALGMRPFELADERPRRLPRGRLDRLELPRRARGVRRRAARAGRRRGRPRAARPARPAHRRELGRAWRRGAHRPDRPRRRGDGRRATSTALERAAPELVPLYEALAERTPSSLAPERADERRRRTRAELREALAPRARGRTIGLARRWAPARGPRLAARGARERCDVVVSLFVNPAQFGPGEDLDAYPRDEAATSRSRRRASTSSTRRREEVYPEGFATRSRSRAHRRPLRRPAAAAPSTSAASRRSSRSCSTPSPRRRLLRPEGRPAGARDPADGRDLDFPAEIVVLPTVREPDGLAMSSRNAYLSAEERERRRRSTGR